LREVARFAGVSLGTARDVRRRLQTGDDPLPPRMRHPTPRHADRPTGDVPVTRLEVRQRLASVPNQSGSPPSWLLNRLRRDPSLRYSEKGRSILQWLDAHMVDPAHWSWLTEGLPDHCRYTLVELALGCATAWQQLAEELRDHNANGKEWRR
jgi:hypothetical protein